MSKKEKDLDEMGLVPELFDGKHQVIPIISGGDDSIEDVSLPEVLPILTLRSSVIFPGSVTPITVGRAKSIALVRAVEASDGLLGAVLQVDSSVEDPQPNDMHKIGTSARILKILEMPNGNLTVILSGLEKIEVGEYLSTQPYFKATVTPIQDTTPDPKNVEFVALVDSIKEVALNIINISPSMPKEAAFAIKNLDSNRAIVNFICWSLRTTTVSICSRRQVSWLAHAVCSRYWCVSSSSQSSKTTFRTA